MEKKILTTMIFVILGVVVGVAVAVQRTTNPVVVEQLTEVVKSLRDIQGRLVSIEEQSKEVASFFKEVQNQNQRALQQAQQRPTPPQEDYAKVHQIDFGNQPIKGPAEARVTLVEFVDIQCPFCQRFHGVINEVLKEYPNDVKYALKHYPLPFHPMARPAAKAVLAAGEQGKYYEMADALLSGGTNNLTESRFEELAKQLNLNVEKFKKDFKEKDAQWEQTINQDMAQATKIEVRGTPTFFLNGRKTMARDLASFKLEIDDILKEASK